MDLVRYNNDLNSVKFDKFKDKELDLFFALCYKMKNQGTEEVSIDFNELKGLSQYTNTHLDQFINDLDNTYKKLIGLNFLYEDEKVLERFVLFIEYRIDKINRTVNISINPKFKYLLNELGRTYTKFELEQFVSLRSLYSKKLFKLLKQWESVRKIEFEIETFRELLDIPKSYDFSKLNDKILKNVMKEISPYFLKLQVEKIRGGRKIKKLNFTWSKSKKVKIIKASKTIDINVSRGFLSTIKKVSQNKYLNNLLTKVNIHFLLEKYPEDLIDRSLHEAYSLIDKEINLSYLSKFIENRSTKEQLKFNIISDASQKKETLLDLKEIKQSGLFERVKTKEKITSSQKEEKYKEYLKLNKLKDNEFAKKSFEMILKYR